ncbi:hypothetical protein GC174_14750 [bacterium]|nr:hypothetical protein [bacterium]
MLTRIRKSKAKMLQILNADNVHIASYSEDTPKAYMDAKLPAGYKIAPTNVDPDFPAVFNFLTNEWEKYSPPDQYKQDRRIAFRKELPIEDQLDALYKYAIMTPTQRDNLVPDATKRVDDPAGWLAKVQEIKASNPKPQTPNPKPQTPNPKPQTGR